MTANETFSAVRYLSTVLGFKVKEWSELSDKDKDTLKRWAYEENGITPPDTL